MSDYKKKTFFFFQSEWGNRESRWTLVTLYHMTNRYGNIKQVLIIYKQISRDDLSHQGLAMMEQDHPSLKGAFSSFLFLCTVYSSLHINGWCPHDWITYMKGKVTKKRHLNK